MCEVKEKCPLCGSFDTGWWDEDLGKRECNECGHKYRAGED